MTNVPRRPILDDSVRVIEYSDIQIVGYYGLVDRSFQGGWHANKNSPIFRHPTPDTRHPTPDTRHPTPSRMYDFTTLTGGLRRIIDRLHAEGTATKDLEADQFLRNDPNAVVVAIFLEQRVRAETAFSGPWKLRQRLGHFDLRKIAEMDADKLAEVFAESPAVHAFTNMMSARLQQLAAAIVDEYDGDGSRLWSDGASIEEVKKRAVALPGIGEGKAKKFAPAVEAFGHHEF